MGNNNVSKHYKVMAGFALDFYMENNIEVDINEFVKAIVEDNMEIVIDKVAEVIQNKAEEDHKFNLIVTNVFMNNFSDYMYHFLFVKDVTKFDKEIEDFILLCSQLANKEDIRKILDELLENYGYVFNTEQGVYIME